MSRFDDLIETVQQHQALVIENYDRVRRLAEELRAGMCDWMDAKDGVCVRLVPPFGQFQPKNYGDEVFSIPPRGFRPLGPIAFGLALRVSRGTDWLRVTMTAEKTGEKFKVSIMNGPDITLGLPLQDNHPEEVFQIILSHVRRFFEDGIAQYREGSYSARDIGFDFSDDEASVNA